MGGPARIESLTGLRALAALAVVCFHLRVVGFAPDGYAALPGVRSLYLGVDLFFLLSGFVLMHVHGAEFAQPRLGTTLRFLGLRLARIYPVHLTVLALLAALVTAQLLLAPALTETPEWRERFALDALLRHLALAGWSSPTWNPPAWSLSAEWIAYLAFPALAVAAIRLPWRIATLTVAALLAGFAAVFAGPFGHDLDRHGLVRVGFEFPAGCLLYQIGRHCRPGAAWAVLAATAAIAAAAFATAWRDFAIVPLLAALLLAASLPGWPARLLETPWLVWLGEISYALYMVHVIALGLLGRAATRLGPLLPAATRPLVVALALAVIVAAAAALHYGIERPVRARARRWLGRRRENAGTIPAALAGT